jgi:hypothetical protein
MAKFKYLEKRTNIAFRTKLKRKNKVWKSIPPFILITTLSLLFSMN